MVELREVMAALYERPPAARRDAALAYAAAGLPVFPCVPGGKTPLTHNGYQEATTATRRIRGWWAWQPAANIGIATGHGVDVLDVDVHPGGDGYQVLRRLHRNGLVSGALQSVRSPSGGVHLYFPSDPARPQRTWARGTSHVDFRGTGGYIIAPPSTITVAGTLRQYKTISLGGAGSPVDADTIRDLLTPPRPPRPRPVVGANPTPAAERLAGWLAGAVEGNRNSSLFWAACRLAELGMDEPAIQGALDGPARTAGLADREIETTIRSAWRTVQVTPNPSPANSPFRSSREAVTR